MHFCYEYAYKLYEGGGRAVCATAPQAVARLCATALRSGRAICATARARRSRSLRDRTAGGRAESRDRTIYYIFDALYNTIGIYEGGGRALRDRAPRIPLNTHILVSTMIELLTTWSGRAICATVCGAVAQFARSLTGWSRDLRDRSRGGRANCATAPHAHYN